MLERTRISEADHKLRQYCAIIGARSEWRRSWCGCTVEREQRSSGVGQFHIELGLQND